MQLPITKGLKTWLVASDAIADRNSRLVYWPDRCIRLWRLRRLYWKIRVLFGYKASSQAPKIVNENTSQVIQAAGLFPPGYKALAIYDRTLSKVEIEQIEDHWSCERDPPATG